MFQFFERLILEFVRWFYTLNQAVGFVTLGLGALVLIVYQLKHQGKRYVPGIAGIIVAFAAFLHIGNPRWVVSNINLWLSLLDGSKGGVPAVPVLEPLFSILVAPAYRRQVSDEILFVAFFTYFVLLAIVSFQAYKRDGRLVEAVEISTKAKKRSQRPNRSKTNELGSGDLATTEQITKWTKPSGKCDTVLYCTGLRGAEGQAYQNSKLILPYGQRNRHILAIAKTGGGKTSRLMLPILYNDCLDPERSTIVIDSKPEMWRQLAAMTRKYNPKKNILLFNPLDRARSLSWNILSKIEDDTDCKLIANTIVMATDNPQSKSDSPFFRNNALSILNAVMVGLLHDPNETLSMPRIHELIQSGIKPLCAWMEAHPEALRTSRTFVELSRSGSQNADTIMSELGMRLSAWDLKAVRATTAFGELDVEDLITKPTLFVVELRESELEMLRPLANVIVVELLRFLTKRAESMPNVALPRPVSFVIDEFASALGRLPDIHVKLNTLRSRNVSIVAAIQSIAQIKANYADDADSVLAGFSTKICMPTLDIQDAEWASKETGQMTIRFQTASEGTNRKIIEWFASRNLSSQEQVQQRAVLTPDEIGRPVDNISTFFMPDTPAFQGYLTPHFKIPEMLARLNEFASDEGELRLREKPIEYTESTPTAILPGDAAAGAGAVTANGLPAGITNTAGWTDDQIRTKLEEIRKTLDWENTTGSARKWWEAFESENATRLALVLRLAEELANRKATITEFFLSYVYSNTDNIQANLHYLDYSRLKKEEERKKREAAQQTSGGAAPPSQPAYG